MITVRKLAERFRLSRTALLYYDRIGLLKPSARSEAGYRLYDSDAVTRLREICGYRSAGLSLEEIRDLMDQPASPDTSLFRKRIAELDDQIAALRIQQRAILGLMHKAGDTDTSIAIEKETWVEILAASGMNEADMQRWHDAFERNAPDAHHSFLQWLGIPERDILKIRKTSRA